MIPTMLKRLGIPIAGGAMVIATATVSLMEGKHNQAYLDPVGIPTICYEHTEGVRLGQTRTDAECEQLLRGELVFDDTKTFAGTPVVYTRQGALAQEVANG